MQVDSSSKIYATLLVCAIIHIFLMRHILGLHVNHFKIILSFKVIYFFLDNTNSDIFIRYSSFKE